jgi:hypothetical protein
MNSLIGIARSAELVGHLFIVFLRSNECDFASEISNKYAFRGIKLLYRAEISDSCAIEIKRQLRSHQSMIGDDIYRIGDVDAINIVTEYYSEAVWVDPHLQYIVDEFTNKRKSRDAYHKELEEAEQVWLDQYQGEFDSMNSDWSEFWDKKLNLVFDHLKENPYPEMRSGFFVNSKKSKQDFEVAEDRYLKRIADLVGQFWKECEFFEAEIIVQCRFCKARGQALDFQLSGPGCPWITYGGHNTNTLLDRKFLGKPEYGIKPDEHRKIYWRHYHGLEGKCSSCNRSLVITKYSHEGMNGIFNGGIASLRNTEGCSIYPRHNNDSFLEWCGVWATAISWFAQSLEYYYFDRTRSFHKTYLALKSHIQKQ